MQEPSIIPQDAIPDFGTSALLLASSSAPLTHEVFPIQVRHFTFPRNPREQHLINISFLLNQAQNSPDNSLFSFQLGTIGAEDEVTSSAESAPLSKETKAKLQEILQLLNQDIGRLVQDAEPIRVILKSLKGTLSESLEEALHLAAYIESHQISVLNAQKRLSDRLHKEQR